MKIYLVVRNDGVGYDEYDSAVVVAESQKEAVQLLINEHGYAHDKKKTFCYSTWGEYDVTVTEIIPTESKIILESFNAS